MIANDSTLKKWRKNHSKSKSRKTNQPQKKKKNKIVTFCVQFCRFQGKMCFFSWTCFRWSSKAHTKLYFPKLPNLCSKQSFQSSCKLTQWPRSFTSFMCLWCLRPHHTTSNVFHGLHNVTKFMWFGWFIIHQIQIRTQLGFNSNENWAKPKMLLPW